MARLSLANFEERATAQKGDFGIGSVTADEAEAIGLAWVGPNYYFAKRGKGEVLISANDLRMYRRARYKAKSGLTQANLQARSDPSSVWESNAHIRIIG